VSGTRSFLAIELAPDVLAALLDSCATLRAAAPDWRDEKWVADENLHITLKFLGNLDEPQLATLAAELDTRLDGQRAFELHLAGLRAVPSLRHCNMVWGRFADDEDLSCARLAQEVDSAAELLGVDPEARQFSPHATLVRARKPRRLSDEALTSANERLRDGDLSMSVPGITLFGSTLTKTGPVYERLAEWRFRPVL
jgi:2'-5' RNA ligase